MMISGNDVKCFLDLSKTLNFTATAENLYMTQQAVSKQIEKLEKTIGLKFFNRSYHAVTLTQDGIAFAELFERFSKEFDECLAQRRKNDNINKNIMTVGFQVWSYYGNVPHNVHMAMNERFPGFVLHGQMHSPDILMSLLEAGKVDIVMLYERLAGPLTGYHSLALKEIDIVLLVSKSRAPDSEDVRFEKFASDPLLIDISEIASLREGFSLAGMQGYGISPAELLIRPNRDSVYMSVELGQGVALGTSLSQTGHLAITKFPTGKADNLICVWREDEKNPRVEAYAELLQEFFQQE